MPNASSGESKGDGSNGANCPVSMHARQIGGGTTVMVDHDGKRNPVPHGIHLTLTDKQHLARIVQARVTVRGLNGKPHAVQSGSGTRLQGTDGGDAWETTRTLTVSFGKGEDDSAETELALAGMSAVSWIRLDSLTFSDGTVWLPPQASACRTAPDPFMLVSGK